MGNAQPVRAPALFVGHGSPMNAIETNSFTEHLAILGRAFPSPQAIVCISAHWLTAGTWVTHMDHPPTIHDFYGFPRELQAVQYPAPGSPELALRIQELIQDPRIQLDDKAWGLDHGTWSIARHLYPAADIPIVQMSIDMGEPFEFHYELGKKLRALREDGILILGSGNIVHNLRMILPDPHAPAFDWAEQFDAWIKERLEARQNSALVSQAAQAPGFALSVPTPDHFLPLLYVIGAADDRDRLTFEFEGLEHGSISMRTLSYRA